MELIDVPGPIGLICSFEPDLDDILKTGQLVVRYSKERDKESVKIQYYKEGQEPKQATVKPAEYKEIGWEIV